MKTIFVVDDSSTNLIQAERALEESYNVITLISAQKMFSLFGKIIPDLILMDIEMPEMDGFAALERLMENEITRGIPVIFLTASIDTESEVRGLDLGAVDFITKPFSPVILRSRVAHHLSINEIIKKRTERIVRLQTNIIFVLADMVENRDKITSGHVERTSIYIKTLIEAMRERGLYKEEIDHWNMDTMLLSARLHDIGKITISDLILNKPGKLSDDEFEVMKTHALEGERIIEQIIARTGSEMFLQHAKFFAGYHHENWDGTGYPYNLKGDAIPLQGRIMAVADVYDALVSERSYKNAFPHEKSVQIIMEDAGKKFDPNIAKVFFEVHEEFKLVKEADLPSEKWAIQSMF
ncbi:MAG: response regulator [Betaproteobacteria bacterium]|nr:response regulator [Betaproteobacteria bacterium]MCL2886254.1 response regulator [Betaproteobacteria bacterium]